MEKSREEMQREIDLLRHEIKVSREASEITADFVVKQFEQTEQMLHRFQSADAERQAVLDAATQLSIIATYLDGTIQLFSTGAATLLGYKPTEMINKRNILSLHLPEELEHYGRKMSGIEGSSLHDMEVFDQFVKQKHSRAQEWIYVCKDGTHLPVSLSVTSLYNPVGRVVGYLFAAMDMTRQKEMERELIQAKEQAEAANASKGEFLARMSHEIRTPMNGIIGMASLLQRIVTDPKQHNYVEKLVGSANTLLRLINDILDFSKIDAGKLELEEVPFNLEDILGNIVNVVGLQADKKGLEFLFRIDPEVSYNLIGDPLRLSQILMNLTGNAVKFTEHGEIVVSVRLEELIGDQIILRFSVQDSGIGLYPDQAENLFAAFSQADDSITRKYGGTGLGLAICRQLTELMGGEIWLESTPGKGTVFFFTVTMRLAENADKRKRQPIQLLQGLRALVVDDNSAARDVLSSMLTSLNINVDTAVDGQSALTCLEEAMRQGNPYDVVLLDWIMPVMDGIETARRIKANASLAGVPAMLMVTANGREEAVAEAERVGMDGFLLKPVYASVMFNMLLDILGIESLSGNIPTPYKNQTVDLESIKGAHILLVDDNRINQEVASEFLLDGGLVVTIVSNGQECLDALYRSSYDLVLMDIQMPVMDGLEATRRIRQDIRFKELPIIAMTAHAMTGDKEKSLAAGMNDHITKPIHPENLYRVVARWINKQQLEKNRQPPAVSSVPLVTDSLGLPPLPGIDPVKTLKRLNYKTDFFLKLLHDFKNDYCSLPARLRELSAAGKWPQIQITAHTIKGVAGYIGSTPLTQAAATLEDALRNNQQQEAVHHLTVLINTLDEILVALSALPSLEANAGQEQQTGSPGNARTTPEAAAPLRILIGQLKRGEATAEEQFVEVEKILAESGVARELENISRLIDDIEYENAADIAQKILTMITEKHDY